MSFKSVIFLMLLFLSSVSHGQNAGDAAAFGGWAGAAGAFLYDTHYLRGRHSQEATVDEIVNNRRTPSSGTVIIFQEPEVSTVRASLIAEQREYVANNRTDIMLRQYVGARSRGAQRADREAEGRIERIEKRIVELEEMSDEDILKANHGKLPRVRYRYDNLDDLRNLLEWSESTHGKTVGVNIINSNIARTSGKMLKGGLGAGVLSYVVVKAINPASAAETRTSENAVSFVDPASASDTQESDDGSQSINRVNP